MTGVPYFSWLTVKNPVLGKLKLKSREKSRLFFEGNVHAVKLSADVPDLFNSAANPGVLTLQQKSEPRRCEVPVETTVVDGMFEDTQSKSAVGGVERFTRYKVKIMLWVETTEESDGVEFDFQKNTSV